MIFISKNIDDTKKIAENFAKTLKKPSVVALYGDLGVGKSAFVRFVIQYLKGKNTIVPSPTFTIYQNYDDISHFDLYRINDKNELTEIGLFYALNTYITFIEWPEIAEEFLPISTIKVYISMKNTYREIKIKKTCL